jgi:hypothetical protein
MLPLFVSRRASYAASVLLVSSAVCLAGSSARAAELTLTAPPECGGAQLLAADGNELVGTLAIGEKRLTVRMTRM